MSIASEKVKLATERFLLVRINPARYILPVLNAGFYEITLPFLINRIERNGVALTKVSGNPANNDEWSQNESTLLVKIQLASAPNDTSNVLTAFYFLYYTGTVFRAIGEDPENPTVNIREWEPRIDTYPTILQSIDNIIAGIFTISDMQLSLINSDRDFQNYLTDNDSFFNKQMDVWLCIGDVTNILKIFTGVVQGVDISQNTVSISAVDSFNKLKDAATMGDNRDEIYFSTDGFPAVVDKDKDKPCPFIFGNFSRWLTRLYNVTTGAPDGHLFSEGNAAVCVSTNEVGTSNNRVWGACRQLGNLKTQSFGSITDSVNISGAAYGVKFNTTPTVYVGDTFKFNNGSDQWGIVTHVGAFNFLGNPYDIICDLLTTQPLVGHTVSNLPSFSVAINDPADNIPENIFYERDYSVALTTTSGGNKYAEITFANNFEAGFGFGTLDPNKHTVFYKTSNDAPESHADAIKNICDIVGIPVNTASFTAAETALDVDVQFSIPNFDEQDYDAYLKYVQDILSSTLGFLKINSDFECVYKLLAAPTSTDVRDKSLTINDQTAVAVGYQDIVTQFIAYNPHNSSFPATSIVPSPSETRESNKARFLHGIENVVRFRHVLETITDRVDAHLDLKSERFVKYRFATATQDIDSEIDTDIQLENDIVLGTTKVKDIKILTIEKSPRQTTVEASDLKGL